MKIRKLKKKLKRIVWNIRFRYKNNDPFLFWVIVLFTTLYVISVSLIHDKNKLNPPLKPRYTFTNFGQPPHH